MPQPAHKPTTDQRRMVEAMSAYGIPQDDISAVVGIDRNFTIDMNPVDMLALPEDDGD